MASRKKSFISASIFIVVLLAVAALIIYWPLIQYSRGLGQPKLYRIQNVSTNSRADNFAIIGGTLVDGAGGPPLENSAILIRGDRITKVGRATEVEIPQDTIQLRADGKTILPGLIDMHVHLNKGDDLQLFLAAGVTTVRDVGNLTSQVTALERGTRSNEIVGPRIFFSGESFVHRFGFARWQSPTKDAFEARIGVRKRIAAGASVIKIVNDITPELVEAIVEEAHRSKIPVTADILGNRLVTAERAINLGVDGLEHVSGVPQSIRADDSPAEFSESVSFTALYGWLYADKQKEAALIDAIIKRGTYIVPTFVALEAESEVPRPKDPGSDYISERLGGFWGAMGRIPRSGRTSAAFLVHFVYSQPFVTRVALAGGRIAAGTDTPTPGVVPGFSMHRELELLVQAGLTPMQAIQAATKTAAEFLGKSSELGTVEPGKLADLIVVDGMPQSRIRDIRKIQTVLKGERAFDVSALLRLSRR